MSGDDVISLSVDSLHEQYFDGRLLPSTLLGHIAERIEAMGRPEVWICLVPYADLLAQSAKLDQALRQHGAAVFKQMPLFGLPFAVKDNIDVAGLPTTAACPAFSYVPQVSATVVQKLQAAGAVLIGKTNLDQFATGLVGTRSPYGAVRNAVNPDYVSGGSSSGSAVAVALDLVTFALGTDTAGSGRVPAGLNGIVGLKPTRGLISTSGVVPACRSLDCVSVFSKNVQDAWRVLRVAAGFDGQDPYSRKIQPLGVKRRGYRVAVPDRLEFFGDAQAQAAFEKSLFRLGCLPNVQITRIPFAAFSAAAKLLYGGPWVAERMVAIGSLLDEKPEALDPTVRSIVAKAATFSALDGFKSTYHLAELKRTADKLLADVDFLVVPTTPTIPTIEQVAAEPILRNSELGYYTNFVNFFDLAALSIPTVMRADGLPAGITLIGACGADHLLAAVGEAMQAEMARLDKQFQRALKSYSVVGDPLPFAEPTVQLAVVGAHLEGQPLNWQLLERGARKTSTTKTSAHYQLFALPNTQPPKPGLVRVADGGTAIAVEVWEMPLRHFGSFVADIPAPLGIGSVQLADASFVKGFICEPWALEGAKDISSFGGWLSYLASQST